MIEAAERAKKEILAFLKKNESTGTAKEDFCELKKKTEQAFFVSLALDLRERRAKLWMQGKHEEDATEPQLQSDTSLRDGATSCC